MALVGCIPIPDVAVHLNIKIGQSSYKMYSNNILNFQEFKCLYQKVWKLIEGTT